MNYIRLSLIAASCAAMIACSSNNGPSRLPESTKNAEAVKKAEAKVTEKDKQLLEQNERLEKLAAELEKTKKTNAELTSRSDRFAQLESKLSKALRENEELQVKEKDLLSKQGELSEQLAKIKEGSDRKDQTISNQQEDLTKLSRELEVLKAEKLQLDKDIQKITNEKNELLVQLEQINQIEREKAEQARREEAERKADEQRVAQNTAVIQKSLVDNGSDEGKISYVSGGMISIDGNTLSFMPVADKSKKVNELIVDGKTVTLFSVDKIAERQSQSPTRNDIFDIVSEEFSGKVGSLPTSKFGDDFAQLRYGYIKDKNGKTTLFVQGHQTPTEQDLETPFNYYSYVNSPDKTDGLRTLETDAVYRYAGSAFYGKDSNYQQFNVEVAADMVNKKVKVDLKEGDTNKLTFGGNIEGSSFSGNYQGVEAKGAFYGTRGQDIGGLFYQTQGDEKDYSGVFGATKQNCSWRGCEKLDADTLKDFNLSK